MSVRLLVSLIVAVVGSWYLGKQVRKPTKWTGRLFLWLMNLSHSSLTDWGLSHIAIDKRFNVLDVGCGGGRTIEKLAALASEGTIYGVDYADGSVAASRAKNARLIEAGRVEVTEASVSCLPFPDGQFDLVTAVETHYYWPDLVSNMREILRVLKPGGTLIIIAESYKKSKYDRVQGPLMKLLGTSRLSAADHRDLFEAAGYREVQTLEQRSKGWICAIGRKG